MTRGCPDGRRGHHEAEIIFTSGATAEPKGVVLTHKNILANIVPIEREMAKYRRVHAAVPSDPFPESAAAQPHVRPGDGDLHSADAAGPGRLHPQLFAGRHRPPDPRAAGLGAGVRAKMLEVLQGLHRASRAGSRGAAAAAHWAKRWWRYRRVHELFGFKFWAMVVGAAPLDPELEAFWGRLGFVVVQGYGLTETAPIVTLNHPLRARARRGRQADRGRRNRIAEDGEILVRGENVTTGYLNAPEATRDAFAGRLVSHRRHRRARRRGAADIRGRKKEMIVTPEGLNVFPEDVERALNAQPGVRDSAVVGAPVPARSACRPCSCSRRARTRTRLMRGANAALGITRRSGRRSVARRRTAADRGHEEAQAPRAARGVDGTANERPTSRPDRQVGRARCRGHPPALRARPNGRVDDDDRRTRPDVARARRADDGARGSVPDHGRRIDVQRGDNRWRVGNPGRAARFFVTPDLKVGPTGD